MENVRHDLAIEQYVFLEYNLSLGSLLNTNVNKWLIYFIQEHLHAPGVRAGGGGPQSKYGEPSRSPLTTELFRAESSAQLQPQKAMHLQTHFSLFG